MSKRNVNNDSVQSTAQPHALDWYPENVVASVHLTAQQQSILVNGNDAAVDTLISQLQHAGMNTLDVGADVVAQMANHHVSFDASLHVTVEGTSFLSSHHVNATDLHTLLGAADVTVRPDWNDMGKMLNGTDAKFDTLVNNLHNAGVDTLAFEAGQIGKLASAGFSLNAGTQVTIDDDSFLHAQYGASMAQLHKLLDAADVTVQMNIQDLADLKSGLGGLQQDLVHAGVDNIAITDDLANALAQADIHFLQSIQKGGTGENVVLVAQEDNQSGTAYLNASLDDLHKVGVDEVNAGVGVHKIEVALRDANVTAPQFTLDDLPHFNAAHGTAVSLVVDENDLAALLSDHNAFAKLAADGFTEVHYTGNHAPSGLHDALAANGLSLDTSALTATEVQLLGLSDQSHVVAHDPVHKG